MICVLLLEATRVGKGDVTIRILVVDDFELWRRFACARFQTERDFQVIGEASDGLAAVEKAKELQPDLILLDIGLPGLNGIEAGRQIRELSPASKILFVTADPCPDIAREALGFGAHGYLCKSDTAKLMEAARAVLRGKRFFSSSSNDADNSARKDSDTSELSIACRINDNSCFGTEDFAKPPLKQTRTSGNISNCGLSRFL